MKKGSEGQPITLSDLGFHPEGVMDLADRGYVALRPGESFPSSVTHVIDGETQVVSMVARVARARFDSIGLPARIVEPEKLPQQSSGSKTPSSKPQH